MRFYWKRKYVQLLTMWKSLYHSFAIQLLLLNLKENLFITAFWGILYLFISGRFASNYGVQYIFLDPEYLDKVNFWSFFLVGSCLGLFTISWHVISYMLLSWHFAFLASMKRPLNKFIINNSIIPLSFFIYYLVSIIRFQYINEYQSKGGFIFCSLGFILGFFIVFISINAYFGGTIQSLNHIIPHFKNPIFNKKSIPIFERKTLSFKDAQLALHKWKVHSYFNELLQIKIVRSVDHYDAKDILRVFRQHHIHTFVIQAFLFAFIIFLGFMMGNRYLMLPAVASGIILITLMISIIGAVTYWFNGWQALGILAFIIVLNFLMEKGYTHHQSKAFGLNYSHNKIPYNYKSLDSIASYKNFKEDKIETLTMLNNWLRKNKRDSIKPKMVIVNVSGGGARAALWGTKVLQLCDSISNGLFFKRTTLIAGASGGMLGAAYHRELKLQQLLYNKKIDNKNQLYNIGKDLTNPIIFAISVNDFYPYRKFRLNHTSHFKDRAYLFEQSFCENTFCSPNKKISDYYTYEQRGDIPLMIFAPTIINDGRKLFISSHKTSYLMKASNNLQLRYKQSDIDGVDFKRFFRQYDADSLHFSTAARMNATYPYILPSVYLPSNPSVQVMDAGIRDNQGYETSLRFLKTFRHWINENTSGVILVEIRETEKIKTPVEEPKFGIFHILFQPLGGLFSTWMNVNDYNSDHNIADLYIDLNNKVDLIRFEYIPKTKKEEASMSFHLTNREKKLVVQTMYNQSNMESLNRLKKILK